MYFKFLVIVVSYISQLCVSKKLKDMTTIVPKTTVRRYKRYTIYKKRNVTCNIRSSEESVVISNLKSKGAAYNKKYLLLLF